MPVKVKNPSKPGYMSTEFWGMAIYGLYTLGDKVGLSSEEVDQTASSFSDLIDELGDNPTQSVMLGIIIVVYTLIRGYLKKNQIIANAKLEIANVQKGLGPVIERNN